MEQMMTLRIVEKCRTRESIAYHEAGHAVVNVLLGLPVESVKIIPGRRQLHGARMRTLGTTIMKVSGTVAGRRRRAESSLAGPLAEERFLAARSREDVIDLDRVTALDQAPKCRRGSDAALDWFADRAEKARRLIDKHWSIIGSVAACLLERKALTGAELKDVMRSAGWKEPLSDVERESRRVLRVLRKRSARSRKLEEM
jgi:ATP-dependent Zn protease